MRKFLRLIWRKFLFTCVFRSSEKNGEYFRNQFGSIISPIEFRNAWDQSLTQRALELHRLLKSADSDLCEADLLGLGSERLVRIGSEGDGGYFLPESYSACDGAISGGISDNNDFEFDLSAKQIPVMQFDHSIQQPPRNGTLLYFSREKLGVDGTSLSQTLEKFKQATGVSISKGILKLDIEGSEFDFLSGASDSDLLNFDIIVVEFHYLGNIYSDSFWEKVELSLRKIRLSHKPIVAIGNNSRPLVQIGGIPIYDIVEITFIRNDAEVPYIDRSKLFTRQISERAALKIF